MLVITASPLSEPDEFVSSGNGLANFTSALASDEADLAAMVKASCAMLAMVHFVSAIILLPKALIVAVTWAAQWRASPGRGKRILSGAVVTRRTLFCPR